MHDEIKSIKSQIDELKDVCDNTAGADNVVDSKFERLCILLLKLQDGVLEEKYFRRMEKWLLADPAALRNYLDLTLLCAGLRMFFKPAKFNMDITSAR